MCNELQQDMSLMEQVAYFARVSNPANQNNLNTSEKLCRYLLKNSHFSPFEMVNVCLEINLYRTGNDTCVIDKRKSSESFIYNNTGLVNKHIMPYHLFCQVNLDLFR